MSRRRPFVEKRLTLIRTCGTCGKTFSTTAESPWIRQVPRDGKKQATTYYCSTTCFRDSYKHVGFCDGKAEERRREKDRNRDSRERCRRYNAAHREERAAYAKERRRRNPGLCAADNAYARKKRRLLAAEKKEDV